MKKLLLVTILMFQLFSPEPPVVKPVRGTTSPPVELNLEEGEEAKLKVNFVLEIDEVEIEFTFVEVTLGPPTFTIPDTPRTRELNENRVYYEDGMYWTAGPAGADYYYSGPMDGSQFYCQHWQNEEVQCYKDFLEGGEEDNG